MIINGLWFWGNIEKLGINYGVIILFKFNG